MKSNNLFSSLLRKDHWLAYFILLLTVGIHVYIWLTSRGIGFGGDSFNHFNFAHFSWEHPDLLLNLWAKPFFTLIASPFAQFGFKGIEVFNLLCYVFSAYFLYKISRHLGFSASWSVIVFLAFTPIYVYNLASGYTEPFFGMAITLSIYLVLKGYVIGGVILASFLPLIRSEGFFFLPLFFLVLLLKNHYKYLPLLLTGLLVYSFIGLPVKGDFLWIFTENPYKFDSSVYGSGHFNHFFNATPKIFGVPLISLSLLGLILLIFNLLSNFKQFIFSDRFAASIIFIGGLWIYFMAHTIFWWQGIFGSLGLIRVMAGIAPCLAFSAIYGIQALFALLDKPKINWIPYVLALGLTFWAAILPFELKNFPIRINAENGNVKKAALWLKQTEFYPPKRLYYMNQVVPFFLEMDPFDSKKVQQLPALDKENPAKGIPEGSIIYWDSHYGLNEADLPKEALFNSPDLKVIKHVKPEPTFEVLGDNVFELYFFVKE